MANRLERVPVREQDPKVRATNFDEVCYGYSVQEAMQEASRCLNCRRPGCMLACPVSIKIPAFIEKVAAGDFEAAGRIIAMDSSLPAICGRVCPQESQCEGSCILGFKGQPVAIGKLERFVADWSRENGVCYNEKAVPNGKKVAIVGSGPAGLPVHLTLQNGAMMSPFSRVSINPEVSSNTASPNSDCRRIKWWDTKLPS